MKLNRREQLIAAGLGAVVVLVVVWQLLVSPYFDQLDEIDKLTSAAKLQDANDHLLFDRKARLDKVWAEMTKGGLRVDPSEAESQVLKAVLDWAEQAGVNLTALKPERPSDEGQFQVISYHVTGTGSTPAMAKFLWALETPTIPVRVNDMQVNPRKEGTDDLSVQLSLSTLCLRPDADKAKTAAVANRAGASDEVQP